MGVLAAGLVVVLDMANRIGPNACDPGMPGNSLCGEKVSESRRLYTSEQSVEIRNLRTATRAPCGCCETAGSRTWNGFKKMFAGCILCMLQFGAHRRGCCARYSASRFEPSLRLDSSICQSYVPPAPSHSLHHSQRAPTVLTYPPCLHNSRTMTSSACLLTQTHS